MTTRRESSFEENLHWGIRRGLGVATLYSAYVLVMAILQRSLHFEAYGGANVFQFVLIYAVGGLLGGAIIGALRPLNATAAGGALVGALASVPFCMGALMLLEGIPTHWPRGMWVLLAIFSGVGALLGMHFATSEQDK